MEIYFLRHANAGQPKLSLAAEEKRALDEPGIEQSHAVGRTLAALDLELDAIVSSPLLRAFQTAEIVAKEIRHQGKIVTDSALRPEGSYQQFQELLSKYQDKDKIMVAGHNPSLTEFLNQLLAADGSFHAIDLKKGAVAKVEREGHNAAMLKWLMPPKVVRAIQKGSASSSRPKTERK